MNEDTQYYPETPDEVQAVGDLEQSKVTASAPAVQDMHDWLVKLISDYDHMGAMGNVDSDTDAHYLKARLILLAEFKQQAESELAAFKSTYARYIDEQQ